jgi:hypothetical protein
LKILKAIFKDIFGKDFNADSPGKENYVNTKDDLIVFLNRRVVKPLKIDPNYGNSEYYDEVDNRTGILLNNLHTLLVRNSDEITEFEKRLMNNVPKNTNKSAYKVYTENISKINIVKRISEIATPDTQDWFY